MKPASPPCAHHGDWKSLYRAAILETNKNIIQQKVSAAEQAVLARGRELSHAGVNHEERESLEDALYALRAYRSAWQGTKLHREMLGAMPHAVRCLWL